MINFENTNFGKSKKSISKFYLCVFFFKSEITFIIYNQKKGKTYLKKICIFKYENRV